MADDSSDDDKTESATPRRLEKAREEGQVPRSRELATFFILLGGILGLWGLVGLLYEQLSLLMEKAFLFDRQQIFDTASTLTYLWSMCEKALLAILPLFLLSVVLAIVGPSVIGGILISAKSLQPQLSRLNPLKGLQRMVSAQALAELGKAIAKSVLVGTVAFLFIKAHMSELLGLPRMPLQQALAHTLHLVVLACVQIALALIIVVAIDVPYQLWSYAKKLRMSKEELKREHKESEGDPHLKGRIRAQQQAMARSRMMSKVPTADVIVTNPTHFAVALSYQENKMKAPFVVAKGVEAMAARIRDTGAEHEVPLLEAASLARALYYHVDLEQEIPAELYTAVAEVLAWAYRLKRVREEGGEQPDTPHDLPVPAGMDLPRGKHLEE